MRVPQRIKKYIALFFLLLFISYTAGITLFYHSHVINGVTIVHSHPYNKANTHTHSSIELDVIHQLNQFFSTILSIPNFTLGIASLFVCVHFIFYRSKHYKIPYHGIYKHRGPPSVIYKLSI